MSLPYPAPTSAAISRVMRGNRRSGTKPEMRLRSELHRRGLRYRLDVPVTASGIRVVPDIAFPRARLAVFVDGCFWHRCPQHGVHPSRNVEYWTQKLERNVVRDRSVDAALQAAGWNVLRVWEHEPVGRAADHVASAVTQTHDAKLRSRRVR